MHLLRRDHRSRDPGESPLSKDGHPTEWPRPEKVKLFRLRTVHLHGFRETRRSIPTFAGLLSQPFFIETLRERGEELWWITC
jgi:hypothetical protein